MLLHNFVRVGQGVTLFTSQDHGVSWKPFCAVSPADESKVVQLHDDTLVVNSRLEPGKRYVHRSADGGRTWESKPDWNLPDPKCNAGSFGVLYEPGHSEIRFVRITLVALTEGCDRLTENYALPGRR